jgi:ketosteroid isomerase-like protein
MSEQNVELARRGMESMEAFVSLLDECVVADVRAFPLPDYAGVLVGRDKFIEMSRHYWGAWEDYSVEAEDFIEAGQSVVIGIHEQGRGKGSGVHLDRRWAHIWTFREGRIVRWEPRRSIEDAVEAAGLPAQRGLHDNAQIVRRLFERWERGQWEAGGDVFHDACDVVFSTSAFPDAGSYRVGREALRAWLNFTEAFEEFATEIEQVVEADERVIVLARIRGRGRASGVDVDSKVGAVFTLRDGKIVRYELTDRQEALEATGLSE